MIHSLNRSVSQNVSRSLQSRCSLTDGSLRARKEQGAGSREQVGTYSLRSWSLLGRLPFEVEVDVRADATVGGAR